MVNVTTVRRPSILGPEFAARDSELAKRERVDDRRWPTREELRAALALVRRLSDQQRQEQEEATDG